MAMKTWGIFYKLMTVCLIIYVIYNFHVSADGNLMLPEELVVKNQAVSGREMIKDTWLRGKGSALHTCSLEQR